MAPAASSRTVLSFGVFELDTASHELRRSGLAIRIQPQALRVLRALLDRPGEIVSRAELRHVVWGERTFVAFDRGLNFCLSRIRGALGDDARRPRFVETVPGHGYRFIAPVRVSVVPSASAVSAPSGGDRPRAERRRPAAAIAMTVVVLLTLALPPRGQPPRDAAAAALYAQARRLCGSSGWRESVRLYREASAREPGFAAAHAGMAESYLALGEDGSLDAGQAFPAARESAQRALAIEDRADAHVVLGRALLAYDWDWIGAERELRRAVGLDPASVRGWASLARYLSARGEHAGAIRAAQQAEALDPGSLEAVQELAWCLYRARRFDEAARRFRLIAARRPEEVHHRLFAIFRLAGRHQDALREANALMRRVGVADASLASLQRLRPERAADAYLRGTLAHLRREASEQRVPPERVALLHAELGDAPAALRWLAGAVEARSPGVVTTLMDPTLDPLRAEAGFVTLARRVGSPAARAAGSS